MTALRGVLLTLLPVAALEGCDPTVKNVSPNFVTIESYQMNTRKVQELADTECAKHNRRASLTSSPTTLVDRRNYIFACVEWARPGTISADPRVLPRADDEQPE